MKCGKVKNPCKICLQSVSNKNGVQCKGACKKWAHYKCLDYTPGKIKDIKAGLITITCPCPDCTVSEPKEFLTKPSFTCKNEGCPATKPPQCEVPDCPNKPNPIPSFPTGECTPPVTKCPEPAVPKCPTPPPPCPASTQKPSCPASPQQKPCLASPEKKTCPQKRQCSTSPQIISRPDSPQKASCPASPSKLSLPCSAPSPRKATSPKPCPPCPTHCPKSSGLKLFIEKIISPKRSQSCSTVSSDSAKTCVGPCMSDSALVNVEHQKMLYGAVEQMCDTVGHLTSQLKGLMCNMRNTFQKNSRNRN